MTTGPGDEKPAAARGHLRTSYADREHVIDTLKAAFVQGRLTKDELDMRVGQTFASRTYAELATVTADIPAGLTAAPTPHKAAQAHARPPMNNAAKSSVRVAIAVVTMAVAIYLTRGYALFLFVPFSLMHLLVAGIQMLDSRHQKRSRGQLPPRPAQHGQALEQQQGGTTGDDLMLSEVDRDIRAGHRGIPRTRRSRPVRRDQRRRAHLQVTA
jgi:hypothetical protein